MKNISKFFMVAIIMSIIISCNNDDDSTNIPPIAKGTSFSITNTFQRLPDFENEFIFRTTEDMPELTVVDGLDLTFFTYEIDVEENSITFSIPEDAVQNPGAPPFRIIEENTWDRYYFTFTPSQNITSATVVETGVSVSVITENVLVPDSQLLITIGEGFSFMPGTTFTVNLE